MYLLIYEGGSNKGERLCSYCDKLLLGDMLLNSDMSIVFAARGGPGVCCRSPTSTSTSCPPQIRKRNALPTPKEGINV